MNFNLLQFAYPLWLWGLFAIPFVWALVFLFYKTHEPVHQLESFIDRHLLPHLLVSHSSEKRSFWKTLIVWSVVWSFLTVAMAGPRWSFREIETCSKDQSLVILLDLSESMNGSDVKPSRLIRAKQKIEDLINLSKGVKIGLIAFAADPHMIAPITEDKEMIRHVLPSLETDLVYVQGSRLSLALDMASQMLEIEPGSNKAVLVMSDGGFEDASSIGIAKKLSEKGFVIHAMGIGSFEGAPLRDRQGNIIKKNGVPILSKLEKEKLKGISEVGKGHYLEGQYLDQDEILILKELEKRAETQVNRGKKTRFWDEHFYLFILPILPIVLWWFKRGSVFSVFLVFFMPFIKLEAALSFDSFKNSEEQGKLAMEKGDYEAAIQKFKDPYRAGVAYYRAGQFAEAEKMFRESSRKEVSLNSEYNLGNCLVQQKKFKEALEVYESVLAKEPDHLKAKENLELVQNLLKETEEGADQDGDQKGNSKEQDQKKKGKKDPSSQEENQDQNESSDEDSSESKDLQDQNEDLDKDSSEGKESQEQDLEGKDPQENKELAAQDQEERSNTDSPKEEESQDNKEIASTLSKEQKDFPVRLGPKN